MKKSLLLVLSLSLIATACAGGTEEEPHTTPAIARELPDKSQQQGWGWPGVYLQDDGRASTARAVEAIRGGGLYDTNGQFVDIRYVERADTAFWYITSNAYCIVMDWNQYAQNSSPNATAQFIHDVRNADVDLWGPELREVPIVVVSENPADEAPALAAGANDFILKSADPETTYMPIVWKHINARPYTPQ